MDKKILAIIAVIVVILVACGAYFAMGSSGDTVRIGHLQSDHDSALFVAKAQDQYAKNGINVQITQFNNGGGHESDYLMLHKSKKANST